MDQKMQASSIIKMIGGDGEQAEKIVEELDRFFERLNAEVEDWKISMEEFKDGTRIYARVQILIKK
ncbi:MAG: hypothetical protein QW520_01635 [Methanomassiliicoccales archaeon]